MAKHRVTSFCAQISIMLVAFSLTTFAKGPAVNDQVVEASLQADHLLIQPTAEFVSYKVTLIGPDGRYEYHFSGEETAFLSLATPNGEMLLDGQYKFEVTATPYIAEDLLARKANLRGLSQAPSTDILSGVFTILQGEVVLGNDEFYEPKLEQISAKGDATSTTGTTGGTSTSTSVAVDLDDNDTRDQVFLDDLIVDGSACVGFDCVNGESFGFDTLRLKENNLRIKFQDSSSSSGSFPSNDWQITANDSANGGSNKFSIDDIDGGKTPFTIEAGAPSHSLFVEDSGDIGVGTSSPVVEVHIVDGDSPTLRFEQNGSSGFTPQTWDLAGNETNFFVRDVTNGSALPFRIRPGADDSAIDIQADNDIGLGTSSPNARLHVNKKGGDEDSLLINTDGGSSTDFVVTSAAYVGMGSTPGTSNLWIEDTTGRNYTQVTVGDATNSWTTTANGTNYTLGLNGASSIFINGSGNVTLGANQHFVARNDGDLRLSNATTPPVGPSAGLINLWAQDVSGSSELKVLDEAGNTTTLSPHNFSLIGEASEPLAWSYYSEKGDNAINVDMLHMARLVEQLSGEKLVHLKNESEQSLARSLKIQEQSAEVAYLKEENQKLKARFTELKAMVKALADNR